jgi:hypothetical protein
LYSTTWLGQVKSFGFGFGFGFGHGLRFLRLPLIAQRGAPGQRIALLAEGRRDR